jgi:hypothetical protein
MSEALKDIRFIHYLLKDLLVEVILLTVVKTDHFGAIFMSENVGMWTLIMDLSKNLEFIKDGFIKMEIFYSTETNLT